MDVAASLAAPHDALEAGNSGSASPVEATSADAVAALGLPALGKAADGLEKEVASEDGDGESLALQHNAAASGTGPPALVTAAVAAAEATAEAAATSVAAAATAEAFAAVAAAGVEEDAAMDDEGSSSSDSDDDGGGFEQRPVAALQAATAYADEARRRPTHTLKGAAQAHQLLSAAPSLLLPACKQQRVCLAGPRGNGGRTAV